MPPHWNEFFVGTATPPHHIPRIGKWYTVVIYAIRLAIFDYWLMGGVRTDRISGYV